MMKPAQRSAMWPPSTTQSATDEAPYFGIQNRTAGDRYSIAERHRPQHQPRLPFGEAAGHPENGRHDSQTRMRTAFRRAMVRPGGVDASRKIVRPTCIAL